MQAADLISHAFCNVCRLSHDDTCLKAHLWLSTAPAAVMCSLQEVTRVPNRCGASHMHLQPSGSQMLALEGCCSARWLHAAFDCTCHCTRSSALFSSICVLLGVQWVA